MQTRPASLTAKMFALITGMLMLVTACGAARAQTDDVLVTTDVPVTTTTVDPQVAANETKFYKQVADQAFYSELAAQAEFYAGVEKAEADRQAAVAAAKKKSAGSSSGRASGSGGDGDFFSCVVQRESGGDYTVVNRSSGAAGAYQMMPATGDMVARGIGRPDLVGVPANQWPPSVQDQGAAWLYSQMGESPWNNPGGKQC